MSVSENIRALAREGLATAEIARRLGIRYQHAYNVLKAGGTLPAPSNGVSEAARPLPQQKPPLSVDTLIAGGFTFSGRWLLSATNDLVLNQALPKGVGVYAFAKDGIAPLCRRSDYGACQEAVFLREAWCFAAHQPAA